MTFAAGQGDALLAMTYTTAKKVIAGKVPDLQLLRVNLWRGFSELAVSGAAVTNFSQRVGKGLLVSPDCDPSFNFAPSAISLVEPAATGLVLQTLVQPVAGSVPLERAIDVETLFSGFTAYDAAVCEIVGACTLRARGEVAQIISAGITRYYGNLGLALPAPVVAAAPMNNELVMRGDLSLAKFAFVWAGLIAVNAHPSF